MKRGGSNVFTVGGVPRGTGMVWSMVISVDADSIHSNN